ncbi:hypothetical protein N7528_000628 [Penicillium herquei]|nr:hypothetical protein N7528_000628 [Penicillium herquei]
MSADPILDKKGQAITQGDYVLTKIRGGHREGEVRLNHFGLGVGYIEISPYQEPVEKVVTDQAEALAERVTNPPKVSGAQLVSPSTFEVAFPLVATGLMPVVV